VKFRSFLLIIFVFILGASSFVNAQTYSAVGQFTSSTAESFAGGISGDGRFVVFESRGNLATVNPRNADNNTEIFLFDYAQRQIFQITDTKSVLFNPNASASTFSNVRIEITNTRPVISRDGRWIAFSSNATNAYPGNGTIPPVSGTTDPGSFNGNAFTSPTPTPTASPTASPTPTPAANPLTNDANLEIWLYQVPSVALVADLSGGDEIAFADLAGGAFFQVTNTLPSQLPRAATASNGAFVADDNHDASIDNDGGLVAFVSTRNLVPCVGNAGPQDIPPPATREDTDEIFTFVRGGATACAGAGPGLRQVTKTPRTDLSNPIYNKAPTISDLPSGGARVVFSSTGDNPIVGMTGGNNPLSSRNEEIFVADLGDGAPVAGGLKKQLTTTTQTNPGDLVNILDYGRRMSRDGRYVAFDSYADLANESGGTNQTSFALYVYDLANPASPVIRRVGPRSTADTNAAGGDVQHYPGFTDIDGNGTPATLVFETRQNIKADGTIPATESEGLNPTTGRPTQIYSFPLAGATSTFTRLTKLPAPNTFLASTQPILSDSLKRLTFNLALTEVGTGNPDLLSEVFYLLVPPSTPVAGVNVSYATGASGLPVLTLPTPTPTASPSPTPTASPSPTPTTPAAVLGVGPGMVTILNFATPQAIVPRTAVGSLTRSFPLPIELSGVSMSINGVAVGLKSVSPTQIVFVTPPAIFGDVAGTNYDVGININGALVESKITLVPARPDIFNLAGTPTPGGRARVYNVTNRVRTTEPFTVTTVQLRGGTRVASKMRVFLTGVAGVPASAISIRIGSVTIPATSAAVPAEEPGVYSVDFTMPATLNRAGDQPIIITVTSGTNTFSSRLDDTAARLFIL
jgi:uncharacterized protein (TIGR03437 family)